MLLAVARHPYSLCTASRPSVNDVLNILPCDALRTAVQPSLLVLERPVKKGTKL